MFFYEGIKAGGRMIKSVCACLCCCICAGPILVIVGVVIIASPNTRKDAVNSYNVAVAAWISGNNNADVNGWLPGTIGTAQANKETTPVTVMGNTDGVSNPQIDVSFVTGETPFVNPVSAIYKLNNVKQFSINVPTDISKTVGLYCSSDRGCDSGSMNNECRSKYPSGKYLGNGCNRNGPCGSCQYTVYVKDICAVAKRDSSDSKKYIHDSSMESCNYPFTSTSHTTTSSKPTNVRLSLRTSDDPYIALQRTTKGTNDFGISKSQQVGLGFACIGVGILLILCLFVFIFILYKLIKMAVGKTGGAQNQNSQPQQQYPQPQQQYPQPQQQYYPNSPPGYIPDKHEYPQPYQQYPQAPPATTYGNYGQPQTGYGVPPPPQVQPGYGYGYNQPPQQSY